MRQAQPAAGGWQQQQTLASSPCMGECSGSRGKQQTYSSLDEVTPQQSSLIEQGDLSGGH